MVELVYYMAHTDIRTDLQRSGNIDISIAATTPVVVFHLTAIHRHDTTSGMDDVTGILRILSQHLIIQRNEYRGGLKHRTWFTAVTHGRVDCFDVVAVFVPHQIDDSLHVAGLYFHQDSHTQLTIDLRALQHIQQRTLCQVLHIDINGRHDITTVFRQCHRDIHIFIQHLATTRNTGNTTKDGIVGEFQTIIGGVFGTIQTTNSTHGQRTKRTTAGIKGLIMETALITGHIKEWQLTDLDKGVIVDAAFPNGPVTGTNGTVLVDLVASLLQVMLELCRRFRRENLVQTITNRIQLVKPQRVALLKGCCLEVHKDLVFRDRSSHQLSVTAEDIASVGLHADTVTLQAVGNLRPVLLLGSHDIEGLANHSKPDDCQ